MNRSEANRLTVAVNDGFSDELKRAFEGHFPGVEIESRYDLLSSFSYVTSRVDGADFEAEQVCFIAAFEVGYMAARALLTTALESV